MLSVRYEKQKFAPKSYLVMTRCGPQKLLTQRLSNHFSFQKFLDPTLLSNLKIDHHGKDGSTPLTLVHLISSYVELSWKKIFSTKTNILTANCRSLSVILKKKLDIITKVTSLGEVT